MFKPSPFSSQVAYRDRLKDIRATLEVSPFFKGHEVGPGPLPPWAELRSCGWGALGLGGAPASLTNRSACSASQGAFSG